MAERFGFDAYGMSEDMPDPVARSIGQILDHLAAVEERLEDMCTAMHKLGSDYQGKKLPQLPDAAFPCSSPNEAAADTDEPPEPPEPPRSE